MVLGHADTNDVRFLNIACSQYKLQQWKYCALDTQKVFAQLTRSQNMSLEHIAEKTGVSIKHLHKSDDDAELTMEAFKAVLKKIKMTPEEIAEKLNLPLGTVKSRIFFTRQKLQEELKDFR